MTLVLYAVCCAIGIASGLFLIGRSVVSKPVPISAVQARMAGQGTPVSGRGARPQSFEQVLGTRVRAWLARGGRSESTKLVRDLRVTRRTVEKHAYERAAFAGLGFLFPPFWAGVMNATGVYRIPLAPVLVAMVVLSVVGFFFPDQTLAGEAEKQRTEFRYGLSVFLDLVVMLMAGGSGPGEAVKMAAASGQGWVFDELRAAGRRAELRSVQPWAELGDLGRQLGVSDLVEVAASLTMGGKHGTIQIESLTARTDSLRSSLAAKTEQIAETQSEKMLLPLGLVLLGFVVFASFGAWRSSGTLLTGNDQPPPVVQPNS